MTPCLCILQRYIIHLCIVFLKTKHGLKVECGEPATQYKLAKAISSKFIRIKTSSYIGDGPGLQYVGIETGKGIDLGIRGKYRL